MRSGSAAAVESIRGELAGLVAKGRLDGGEGALPGLDRARRRRSRRLRGLRPRAGGRLRGARGEARGLRGPRGRRRARVPPRDEHVGALGDGDGRGPPPSRAGRRAPLLQPRRGAAARRGRAHRGDRRRDSRHRLGRDPQARQARRARRRRAGLRREPHADAPVDRAHAGARERLHLEETDEAALRLGIPMPPSALLAMVGPRVANHVLETLHAAFPDRFPLSPTLQALADGEFGASSSATTDRRSRRSTSGSSRRSPTRRATSSRTAWSPRRPRSTRVTLGAGYPFFRGGITKHLDQTGISQRVAGRPLAELSAA